MKYIFEHLDCNNGHIIIFLTTLLMGVGMVALKMAEFGGPIITGSFAGLLVELKGTANGK